MHAESVIMLVDNGSLEPKAILRHRALAGKLARRLRQNVVAVSILHSDRVPPSKLRNVAAETIDSALLKWAQLGVRRFIIIPLFIGPSRALTGFLPTQVQALQRTFPELRLTIAAPLSKRGDRSLARLMAAEIRQTIARSTRARRTASPSKTTRPRVIVVDHGSPSRAVTTARNRIARQIADELKDEVRAVVPASMERRAGAGYDFNDPLLARVLTRRGWQAGPVIVAPLFILPGRHAGLGGDIDQIIERSAPGPRTRIQRTALVGDLDALVDLLAQRYAEVA